MKTKNTLLAFTFLITSLSFGQITTDPGTGNVGIGTTTPTTKLELSVGYANSVINAFTLKNTFDNNGLAGTGIFFTGYYKHALISAYGNPQTRQGGKLQFQTFDNDAVLNTGMILNEVGNVGIGTTTPAAKLHIQNAGINGQLDYNLIIQKTLVTDNNKSAVGLLFSTEGHGSFGKSAIVHERTGGYGIGNLYFLNNNAIDPSNPTLLDAKMAINSNGNVGIGTTTPTAKLETFNNTTGITSFKTVGVNGSLLVDNVGSGENYYNANNFHEFQIGGVSKIRIQQNGYVGIGTQNPIGKFDVRGNVFIGTTDLSIGSVGSFVQIDQGSSTGNSYSQIRAYSNGGNINNNLALQSTGGNVGIGTTIPDEKLTVKGKIHAQEVRVDLIGYGPDYVFQKYYTGKSELKSDYSLPTLAEIENFTKKNHHLPNVPSAQEIKQNGLMLGEMSNVLLQKVEELTLYAIEQNKVIEELKAQVAILMTKNNN